MVSHQRWSLNRGDLSSEVLLSEVVFNQDLIKGGLSLEVVSSGVVSHQRWSFMWGLFLNLLKVVLFRVVCHQRWSLIRGGLLSGVHFTENNVILRQGVWMVQCQPQAVFGVSAESRANSWLAAVTGLRGTQLLRNSWAFGYQSTCTGKKGHLSVTHNRFLRLSVCFCCCSLFFFVCFFLFCFCLPVSLFYSVTDDVEWAVRERK